MKIDDGKFTIKKITQTEVPFTFSLNIFLLENVTPRIFFDLNIFFSSGKRCFRKSRRGGTFHLFSKICDLTKMYYFSSTLRKMNC